MRDFTINKWRLRFGYGSAELGCSLIWQMISLYLLFFYTDVMMLNPAQISFMFLITKTVDGVTDVLMGYIIDKTNTKWGKSRPWIIWGAIPFAITSILCFSVPNISQKGMIIYAYVTYTLLSLAYTIVNVPLSSMLPALTTDASERTRLVTSRLLFAALASYIVSSFTLRLVDKFGNGNQAIGFRIVMIIFGFISCIVFLFCFLNTKEMATNQDNKPKVKYKLKYIFKNKAYGLYLLNTIWFFAASIIQPSAIIYYFTYSVNNIEIIKTVTVITTVVPVLAYTIVPFLIKFLTKRDITLLGSIINILGILGIFFFNKNTSILLITVVITSIGHGLKNIMFWDIMPDTIDYTEYKYKVNISGLLTSIVYFVAKVSMAFASSLGAGLLAWGNYQANQQVQTQETIFAINLMYIWIPLILSILTFVTFLFYDLDKHRKEIIEGLSQLRNE